MSATDEPAGAGGADPRSVGAGSHWFEAIADHLGPAYLRYSFTKGTEQEVGFLVEALGLEPGDRVLDVGCGPGRHALALAARGVEVLGVDISERFVGLARTAAGAAGTAHLARFERGDARRLPDLLDATGWTGTCDAAISLCQGAFGLGGPPTAADPQNLAPDSAVLAGMARALRPGGRVAVSAFSAYFQVRWLEDTDTFDAATAVNHERTELIDADGVRVPAELWTTCATPRELHLLAERCGLEADHVWSVSPGAYGRHAPSLDSHEFLLVAHRPA